MKRYIPSIDGDGSPIMEESPKGRYYSRADLIAAGVLVPMPATGPWRTDVENAKAGEYVIATWSDEFWCKARLAPSGHGWQDARGRYMNTPIAFATINQLEKYNA